MAREHTDIENINTLKQDNFRVQILSLPNVVLFAQTIELPGLILGEALHPNPNVDVMLPGDKVDFENFVLTFMVDENLTNYLEILNWMFGLGFPINTEQFRHLKEGNKYTEMSELKIQLLTNKANYNNEITFVNAFPIMLSAVQLSYTDDQPTHPTATVEFQYHYYYYGSQSRNYMSQFYK